MRATVLAILLSLLFGGISEGVQTKVVVRALSKDAKFIGTTMGGALIVVKDAETGEVLAKGFTSGGTGNTQRIMLEPAKRRVPVADEETEKFEASVDIVEPRLVTIEVLSPYGQRQSMTKNTAQVWLIPGKDITGDGIIIDIYGFSVDITAPQAHEVMKLAGGTLTVPIRANVVMM